MSLESAVRHSLVLGKNRPGISAAVKLTEDVEGFMPALTRKAAAVLHVSSSRAERTSLVTRPALCKRAIEWMHQLLQHNARGPKGADAMAALSRDNL